MKRYNYFRSEKYVSLADFFQTLKALTPSGFRVDIEDFLSILIGKSKKTTGEIKVWINDAAVKDHIDIRCHSGKRHYLRLFRSDSIDLSNLKNIGTEEHLARMDKAQAKLQALVGTFQSFRDIMEGLTNIKEKIEDEPETQKEWSRRTDVVARYILYGVDGFNAVEKINSLVPNGYFLESASFGTLRGAVNIAHPKPVQLHLVEKNKNALHNDWELWVFEPTTGKLAKAKAIRR